MSRNSSHTTTTSYLNLRLIIIHFLILIPIISHTQQTVQALQDNHELKNKITFQTCAKIANYNSNSFRLFTLGEQNQPKIDISYELNVNSLTDENAKSYLSKKLNSVVPTVDTLILPSKLLNQVKLENRPVFKVCDESALKKKMCTFKNPNDKSEQDKLTIGELINSDSQTHDIYKEQIKLSSNDKENENKKLSSFLSIDIKETEIYCIIMNLDLGIDEKEKENLKDIIDLINQEVKLNVNVNWIQSYGQLLISDYSYLYINGIMSLSYFLASVIYYFYLSYQRKQYSEKSKKDSDSSIAFTNLSLNSLNLHPITTSASTSASSSRSHSDSLDYFTTAEKQHPPSFIKNPQLIQFKILTYLVTQFLLYFFLMVFYYRINKLGYMHNDFFTALINFISLSLETTLTIWLVYNFMLISSGYLIVSTSIPSKRSTLIRLFTLILLLLFLSFDLQESTLYSILNARGESIMGNLIFLQIFIIVSFSLYWGFQSFKKLRENHLKLSSTVQSPSDMPYPATSPFSKTFPVSHSAPFGKINTSPLINNLIITVLLVMIPFLLILILRNIILKDFNNDKLESIANLVSYSYVFNFLITCGVAFIWKDCFIDVSGTISFLK